jgi:hypothetical protein
VIVKITKKATLILSGYHSLGKNFIDFPRHINRPPAAGFIQTRSGFAAFLLRLYGA